MISKKTALWCCALVLGMSAGMPYAAHAETTAWTSAEAGWGRVSEPPALVSGTSGWTSGGTGWGDAPSIGFSHERTSTRHYSCVE